MINLVMGVYWHRKKCIDSSEVCRSYPCALLFIAHRQRHAENLRRAYELRQYESREFHHLIMQHAISDERLYPAKADKTEKSFS